MKNAECIKPKYRKPGSLEASDIEQLNSISAVDLIRKLVSDSDVNTRYYTNLTVILPMIDVSNILENSIHASGYQINKSDILTIVNGCASNLILGQQIEPCNLEELFDTVKTKIINDAVYTMLNGDYYSSSVFSGQYTGSDEVLKSKAKAHLLYTLNNSDAIDKMLPTFQKIYDNLYNRTINNIRVIGTKYGNLTNDQVSSTEYHKFVNILMHINKYILVLDVISHHTFNLCAGNYTLSSNIDGGIVIIRNNITKQSPLISDPTGCISNVYSIRNSIISNQVAVASYDIYYKMPDIIMNYLSSDLMSYDNIAIRFRKSKSNQPSESLHKILIRPGILPCVDTNIVGKLSAISKYLNSQKIPELNYNAATIFRRFLLDNPLSHVVALTKWSSVHNYLGCLTSSLDNVNHKQLLEYAVVKGTRKMFNRYNSMFGSNLNIDTTDVSLFTVAMVTESIVRTIVSPYHKKVLDILTNQKLTLVHANLICKPNIHQSINYHGNNVFDKEWDTELHALSTLTKVDKSVSHNKKLDGHIITQMIKHEDKPSVRCESYTLADYGYLIARMAKHNKFINNKILHDKIADVYTNCLKPRYLRDGISLAQLNRKIHAEMYISFTDKWSGDTLLHMVKSYHEQMIWATNTYSRMLKAKINNVYNNVSTSSESITELMSLPIASNDVFIGISGEKFMQLHNASMLSNESDNMVHCVRGYSNVIATMRSFIFHIDLPATLDNSVEALLGSTVEIGVSVKDQKLELGVIQHRAFRNGKVDNPESLVLVDTIMSMIVEKFNLDNEIHPLDVNAYSKKCKDTNYFSNLNKFIVQIIHASILYGSFKEAITTRLTSALGITPINQNTSDLIETLTDYEAEHHQLNDDAKKEIIQMITSAEYNPSLFTENDTLFTINIPHNNTYNTDAFGEL